jgi:predicted LPLAT superfamily acyltransferase
VTSWKGKTRGGVAGYRIFVAILKYAGILPAYALLIFVAFYFFIFSGGSSAYIYKFYRHRLGKGPLISLINVYRNYFVFGQVMLDKIAVMAGFSSKFSYNFDGEEYLSQMAAGKGGLLISGHIGNFEMAGQMLERLDTTVNIVMLDAEHEKIKDYMSSITTKTFNIINVREDGSHVFEMKRAFDNKEIVCIHGDRFTPGSRKIKHFFLGEEAFFPAGPFYLALQYDIPVSFVFAMKEKLKKYHFYATSPEYYSVLSKKLKRNDAAGTVLDDYAEEFEKMIRKYPLQWFNYYDFWSRNEE